MTDQNKTNEQLVAELEAMRRRVTELEQNGTEGGKQAESIKTVLFQISDAVSVSKNLGELLAIIRQKIGLVIDTTNFYVALYDSKDKVYSFPYSSDAYDEPSEFSQQLLRRSLTDYVRRTGSPLFVNEEMHQELIRQGKVAMVGTPCTQWLGVPLKSLHSVIGVVVVQSYAEPALYSEKDLELMTFVSGQIALAIERKRAEEELRDNEERFRSLFHSVSDGIIISDQSGNIVLWNNGAQNMFGYRVDEIIGKQITEIMPGYYRPHHEEGLRRLNKTGTEQHNGKTLELEGLRKDGSVFPLEFSFSTWQAQGKRFFSAIIRDITKRKQAEEELKTLSAAIEQSPAVVIITDPKGNIEYVNPKFCELTGYSAEEVLGKNPRILQGGEVPKEVYKELWETILSGKVWRGEFHNKKKNGELYWEDASISAIRDDKGHITHFIGLKEDITERKKAEKGLIESEKHYRDLVEQSNDAIYVLVGEKYVLANKAFENMFGYTKKEILSDDFDFMRIVAPNSKKIIEKRRELRASHAPLNKTYEFQGLTSHGDTIYLDVNLTDILWDGKPALQGIYRDVTERKLAEAALHQYAHIVSSSTDMIALLNRDYIYQAVNTTYLQAFKLTSEQIIGHAVSEVFGEEFFNSVIKPNAERCFAGEEVNFQLWVNYPAIGKRFMDITYYPYTDVENKVQGFVVNGRDITARRRAEVALRKSENRYRSLVEQMPDAVYRSTPEGRFVEVNTAMVEMLGYESKKDLLNVNIKKELYFDVAEREVVNKSLNESGNKEIEVFRLRHKNGFEVWVEDHGRLVYDASGNVLYHEGVLRDITARKRAEAEKAKLEEQLHRAQKLETIGTLAGGIAHDFNNILTPIMGYADMALSDLKPKDPLRDDLLHVLKGANRAKELVEQILLFSKQVEKERQPLLLHVIVKEALKLLRPSIPATIDIRQRIDASCDKVLADATQMHEVIVNLCTNAWQSMEEKGGTLTIELKQVTVDAAMAKLHPHLNERGYVRLTVNDTGIGMDNATLEHIFEPFFTTKAVDKGTGMGLSVVYGIVAHHNGDILVDSAPGKGSSFHVYLPLADGSEEISKEEPGEIQGGHESILVVDDEEVVANVVQRMLVRLGYKVAMYNSSVEALKAFRQQPSQYDLIIADLTMPGMTGLDLSVEVQKIRSELPTIIMTGYGESLQGEILNHYGIDEVIGKPIVVRELAGGIRKVLEQCSDGDIA